MTTNNSSSEIKKQKTKITCKLETSTVVAFGSKKNFWGLKSIANIGNGGIKIEQWNRSQGSSGAWEE